MATALQLAAWERPEKARAPGISNDQAFYRNLEEALDVRRAERTLFSLPPQTAPELEGKVMDFSSLDFLSLSATGAIRRAFLDELARHPDFQLGSGGTRLLDGNGTYLETTEAEIAAFHGAETALLLHSGWEANAAIMTAVARAGDAIVFDELIHASTRDGMQSSLSLCRMSFRHNDVESFRETLMQVLETQSLIKEAKRSVLICVESVYSMDGDVVPLQELVQIAKEIFPQGNAQFVVDEAHSTGVFGRQGRGLVCELGLEKDIAIRMHTYGKALAATGAAILCNKTIHNVLVNFARSIIYSTAPSFPMISAIRAGYSLMKSGRTQPLQDKIKHLVEHFFTVMQENCAWEDAVDSGILRIPPLDSWDSQGTVSHVVPVMTRQRYTRFLFYHLQLASIRAFLIDYPVVPKGMSRIRLVFHANNTEDEVGFLAATICEWAQEMMAIEAEGNSGRRIPSAARKVLSCDSA